MNLKPCRAAGGLKKADTGHGQASKWEIPANWISLQMLFASLILGFQSLDAFATTYYVNVNNPTPASPYTNWSTASISIQSAVNLATNGDLVLVTNGFYQNEPPREYVDTNEDATIMARIGISSGVTVSSVNGPAFTLIQGYPFTCVFLAANATLSGFTLTNGIAEDSDPPFGGGAYCQTTLAIITNCMICTNVSPEGSGGGVFSGTLNNCILSNNFAEYVGGGSFNSVLNHCILVGNTVFYNSGSGAFGGTLNNCVLASNTVSYDGSSEYSIGGAACSNVLNNCLLLYNFAYGDEASAAAGCVLTNCTIAENRFVPGADEIPVLHSCILRNCILYYNGYNGFGGTGIYGGSDLKNCCAEPAFGFHGGSNNNFTNAPLFVNTNSDFHLQSGSPCINAGNNVFVSSTTDFDGNLRIVGGTVDIGAYEYQTPTSVISYAWLQQYGLPTDGSVDYADLDGTAFNVYQDWVTGLNPTNSASVLAMLTPAVTNNANGITVTWESVTNILYNLQRSTNLASQPSFSSIQSNITGQAGTTSYTDTSATNNVPYFYRVGVLAP